jgi:ankyrin repeat protein
VGLLWAAYAESDDEKLGRAWRAVLATCPFLELVTNEKGKAAAVFSPSERVDLSCALRSAPYPFRQRLNPWVAFEGWSRATPIPAAVFDNDIYGVRSYLNHHAAAVRRARVIARPWQMVSSLWRANTLSGDPRLSAMHDYEKHARVVLVSACKFGRADIVRELLTRNVDLDATWLPASVAIAEGHNDCLELLLSANAKSLEPIISYFVPEADFFKRQKGKRVLLQAVSMGNVAAIDLLRSAGVPLSFGDTLDENPLTASCCIGQPEIVRAVLRDQAVVAAVMERRSECFHIAAYYGNASCLAVLFEKFTLAQAPAQSIFGDFPPLTLAAIGDDFATVQILLGQPEIDVDEAAPGNKTPLMIASANHNVDITAALLARGADVGIPFIEPSLFNDALQYALQLGQSKVPTASEAANAASTVRLFLQQRPGMFAPHFLRYMKQKSAIYSILKEFLPLRHHRLEGVDAWAGKERCNVAST